MKILTNFTITSTAHKQRSGSCDFLQEMDEEMESLLNSRPSLPELMKKVCLKSRWYEIGGRLGLDSDELDAISFSPDSASVKTSRMYKLWLESEATRRELIEVLEDMELKKQAIDYRKYLEQS